MDINSSAIINSPSQFSPYLNFFHFKETVRVVALTLPKTNEHVTSV